MNPRHSHRSPNAGFTLLEVLVALAIFAMTMAALSGTFQSNVRNATHLKQKTLAHWLASNQLVEFRAGVIASGQLPGLQDREDKKDYAGRQWTIKTKLSQTPFSGFHRVEIRVGEVLGTEFYSYTMLEAYVAKPN